VKLSVIPVIALMKETGSSPILDELLDCGTVTKTKFPLIPGVIKYWSNSLLRGNVPILKPLKDLLIVDCLKKERLKIIL